MTAKKNSFDSNIVTGAIIGGIIGVSALAIYIATRSKRTPLNRLGETISRVGEMLDEHEIQQPAALKVVDKQIRKNEDTISEVLDWVAIGIDLWKKFKK